MAKLSGPDDRVFRGTVTTTGNVLEFGAPAWRVQIWNPDANGLRVFFREEDFDGDVKYVELVATTGYLDTRSPMRRLWLKSATGTSIAVVLVDHA